MRRYMVAGNWKLNKGPAEAAELARGVADGLKGRTLKGDVLVCPPFVSLAAAAPVTPYSALLRGAQTPAS